MPARRETWICDYCMKDACKGGCYYRPGKIRALLANLPNSTQVVTNPNSYGRSSTQVGRNPMEGNWALRCDLMRALDAVAASSEDGPVTRQIVWLAYVGRPKGGRSGGYEGMSDEAIGARLGMYPSTVARRRQLGIRLMVECLNPDYQWQEESE